jgi:very-short-patch-repair endonuclease
MSGRAEAELLKVASRQRSVFTGRQALDAGFSSSTIQRNVSSGRWLRLHRGVFVSAAVEIAWPQRAMGAWFACGTISVLSFRSARAIWGFTDDLDVPHVTVPGSRARTHRGITVHKSGRLDAVTYDGFRVTSPMRTILDLAAIEREDTLATFLDHARRRRLVDLKRFGDYLAEPFAAARRGSGVLRAMVAARDPLTTIDSDAETLLFEALRMGRVPLPDTQFWVTTRRRRCRIDFAYPDDRIAIEVDGWTDHGTRQAFEFDRARQNELVELGWRVVRFTWLQLTTQPVDVAITVATALGLVPSRWRRPRGQNSSGRGQNSSGRGRTGLFTG